VGIPSIYGGANHDIDLVVAQGVLTEAELISISVGAVLLGVVVMAIIFLWCIFAK
jgi:hypothetical protein